MPGFQLTSQKFLLAVDINGEKTKINFDQNGQQGQQVSLELTSNQNWKDLNLKNIKPFINALEFKISGFGKKIDWPLGSKILPLDFMIKGGALSSQGFAGQITSRDRSVINGSVNWVPRFSAQFAGDISPHETWATAWTDTNVYFEGGYVSATYAEGELKISANTKYTQAYGALADSLKTNLRIGLRADMWEVMLYGRNIFDEAALSQSFDTPTLSGSHSRFQEEGEVFGLRAKYIF